ncbi:MAG: hypothetical protein ACR2JK_16740, partial [Geodermatophilaceae bacterium]
RSAGQHWGAVASPRQTRHPPPVTWGPPLFRTPATVGLGAALALVVFMVLGGAAPKEVLPGLPDAGLLVGWLLPVSRLAMD